MVLIGALTGTSSTVYVAGALDADWSDWIARHRSVRGRGRVRSRAAGPGR